MSKIKIHTPPPLDEKKNDRKKSSDKSKAEQKNKAKLLYEAIESKRLNQNTDKLDNVSDVNSANANDEGNELVAGQSQARIKKRKSQPDDQGKESSDIDNNNNEGGDDEASVTSQDIYQLGDDTRESVLDFRTMSPNDVQLYIQKCVAAQVGGIKDKFSSTEQKIAVFDSSISRFTKKINFDQIEALIHQYSNQDITTQLIQMFDSELL